MWEPQYIQYIEDSNELYRRIHPSLLKNNGVTSAAFKDTTRDARKELSVDVAKWTTPEKALSFARDPGTRLASLSAGQARQLDQEVTHAPTPDNYAHALIVGEKTDRVCKLLASLCRLLP